MNNLIKNAGFSFFANFFTLIANFFWLSFFNYQLNVSEVGVFITVMAMSAPIWAYFNFDLRKILASDINKKWKKESYFYLRITLCFVCLVVGAFLSFLIFEVLYMHFVILILISKCFESISELIFGYFTLINKQYFIIFSRFIRFLFTVFFCLFVFFFELNVSSLTIFIAYLLSFLIPFLFVDLLKFSITNKPNRHYLYEGRAILSFSSNLAQEAFFVSLFSSLPVLFISVHGGLEEAAIFGSISYIATAIHLLFSSVLYSSLHYLKTETQNKIEGNKKLLYKALIIILITFIICILFIISFGNILFQILFGWTINSNEEIFIFLLRLIAVFAMIASTTISTFMFLKDITHIQRNFRLLRLILLILALSPIFFINVNIVIYVCWTILLLSLLEFIGFIMMYKNTEKSFK